LVRAYSDLAGNETDAIGGRRGSGGGIPSIPASTHRTFTNMDQKLILTTAGLCRKVDIGLAQPISLIYNFDGPIFFLIAAIDEYKGPDFQYRIVFDQYCVLLCSVCVATFDAEDPISPLGVMGGTHWRYLRSTRKLCLLESGTDELGKRFFIRWRGYSSWHWGRFL
jgi:hypothetical protein